MDYPGAADFMAGPAVDMAKMAAGCGITGVVAPATRPGRVKVIRDIVGELTIISPGVGEQGGSAGDTIRARADAETDVYDECAKKHSGDVQLQMFGNEQLLEIDCGKEEGLVIAT